MGKLAKVFIGLVLLMILGAVIIGYVGEDKVQNTLLRAFMSFGGSEGEGQVFTDSNYTTLGNDPNSFRGAEVEITAYLFHVVPEEGRLFKGNMEIEAYRGTYEQLASNPMDPVHRLWITYNQTTLNYTPTIDTCITIKGTVKGQVEITTASNETTYAAFIEATNIQPTDCGTIPPN